MPAGATALCDAIALAGLALCAASCSSLPQPPPHVSSSAEGIVYAHETHAARDYAELATRIARDVRERLAIEPPFEPFEIWILDHEKPGSGMASTVNRYQRGRRVDRFIEIGLEAHFAREYLLTHELVHWYAEERWALPLIVEEGLAELVACSSAVLGEEQLRVHVSTLQQAVTEGRGVPWAETLNRQRWSDLDEEQRALAYALGYLVAAEIGIEAMPELAGHSASEFFERASIDTRDTRTWRAHVQRLAATTGQLHEIPPVR